MALNRSNCNKTTNSLVVDDILVSVKCQFRSKSVQKRNRLIQLMATHVSQEQKHQGRAFWYASKTSEIP